MAQNRARVAELLGAAPDRLLTVYQKHGADGGDRRQALEGTPPKPTPSSPRTPGLAIGVAHRRLRAGPVLRCASPRHRRGSCRLARRPFRHRRGDGRGDEQARGEARTDRRGHRPVDLAEGLRGGRRLHGTVSRRGAGSAAFFVTDEGSGEPHFDLAGYVGERLARAGVGTVSDLGLCTYCDETRLFSYRRSQHHGETTTDVKFPPSCSPDSPFTMTGLGQNPIHAVAGRQRARAGNLLFGEGWEPRHDSSVASGAVRPTEGVFCWARTHDTCAAGSGVPQHGARRLALASLSAAAAAPAIRAAAAAC